MKMSDNDIPERYRDHCAPITMRGRRVGIVTLAGEPLRIDTHQGVVWFEWHSYFGPLPINRKTGNGRDLGPKHHFWRAVSLWDQQGKRIENGVAMYEHGKLEGEGPTAEELEAQGLRESRPQLATCGGVRSAIEEGATLRSMPARFALGDELWAVYFNAERNCYIPKLEGVVRGVRGDELLVNGRWQLVAYPAFTSEAAAKAFCSANPRVMPER